MLTSNKAGLRIVGDCETTPGEIELLVAGAKQPRRVRIVERDIPCPRIDIALQAHCSVELVGRDVTFSLPLLWQGAAKFVSGEVATFLGGRDIEVPRGTLASWAA